MLPSDSDARRRRGIPFLFMTGDDIKEIKTATGEDLLFLSGMEGAQLGEAEKAQMKSSMSGMKVGLKHSRFGIFFMNVWTWGGEIVLYKGNDYFTIEIS